VGFDLAGDLDIPKLTRISVSPIAAAQNQARNVVAAWGTNSVRFQPLLEARKMKQLMVVESSSSRDGSMYNFKFLKKPIKKPEPPRKPPRPNPKPEPGEPNFTPEPLDPTNHSD
jgi:hypothetical protein